MRQRAFGIAGRTSFRFPSHTPATTPVANRLPGRFRLDTPCKIRYAKIVKSYTTPVLNSCGSQPKRPLLPGLSLVAVVAYLSLPVAASAQVPEFNPKHPLQFYEKSRRQGITDASCVTAAKKVAWVINAYGKGSPQLVPAWQLRLGDALRAAGKDREAITAYGQLLSLPPNTPVNGEFGPYRDIKAYQREAQLNQAIILARLGSRAESRDKLATLETTTSRERLLAAEARLLNHDRVADLLRDVKGDGHPENNWGHWYNPLRAAMLAHAANEPALVKRYAEPIAARGENAEKWPHWKSVWAQADQLIRFSAQGELKTTGLRNGTYSGQAAGFYSPLNVEVKVFNGVLADVRVTKHREDRPRNALDGFVKRLKGASPLTVDAVTGATQTCHGVLLAVEDALRKAAPKGSTPLASRGTE